MRCHTRRYVSEVLSLRGRAAVLDHETILSPESVDAALLASGAAVELVEEMLSGRVRNGFALVRPPGHHAEPDRGMGYCIFNHVAVAAAHAMALGIRRVLIVDWDVHHGNGTQSIFEKHREVLFFSVHQDRLFPDSGGAGETGEGRTINVPLGPGAGDLEYLEAMATVLVPRANAFRPELVLVSAGFDAHVGDPMSDQRVTTDGFAAMCAMAKTIAESHAEGRIALVLEGGYDVGSLGECVRKCIETLCAEPVSTERTG